MAKPTPTDRVVELEKTVAGYRKALSEAHADHRDEQLELKKDFDLLTRAADALEERHQQDLKIIMGHNVANGELRRQISLLQDTIVRIANGRD